MNITDEDMSMGLNLNRKKSNSTVRIRQSSWISYLNTLEMCLESEEEKQVIQWWDMQNTIDNLTWNLDYGSDEMCNKI